MKASESLFESFNSNRVSDMVTAMKGWDFNGEKPSGLFGRVVKISTGGLTLDNSLDLEFTVPFDDGTEANEAEIKIYNLTDKTIGQLKPNNELSITAGYGSDTGVIFTGVISSAVTKWSGQDKITTIKAVDSEDLKERDIESISFKAGVKASYILKTLVGKLGLPIAVFKVKRDHSYTEAVTVSGGLMSAIKQYAEVCGASAYINKRKVYVRPLSDGDNLNFTVTADTGLIDSPEAFTEEAQNEDYTDTIKGVTFKMLLEHRITTAGIISLTSRNISGTYRVREGQHVCNETDFYTEVTAVEGDVPSTTKSGTTQTQTTTSTTKSTAKSIGEKKVNSALRSGERRVKMTK